MLHVLGRTAGFVAALAGIIIIGPLSLTIFMPALPAVQQTFGSDVQLVQLSLSLPLLAVVVAVPLAGWLSDRIGRRPLVLASLLVLLIGCTICMAAQALWVLVVGRVIVGVSGTCMLVVARAIIRDVHGPDELSKAMARYSLAPVAAILIAPLIGAALTEAWGWRGVFAALFATTLAIGLLTSWWLIETHAVARTDDRDQSAEYRQACSRLLWSPVFWGYTWQSVLHFATAFGFVAAAPYLIVTGLGRPATDYGWGLVIVVGGMLIGVLLAERSARRFSLPRQVMAGCLFGVLASAVLPILLGLTSISLSPAILFWPAAVVAVGIGYAMPASQAGIVDAVPEASGLASGISSCLKMLVAAAFAHFTTLPWSRPDLALGIIALAAMALAVVAALPPLARRG